MNPLPRRQHLAIAASAGAGKTYQLVTRYIGLLATGARPSTIAALTFSRKAAGEIFSDIVNRLAEAARIEEQRIQLNRELQIHGYLLTGSNLTVEQISVLLQGIIREMHQTRIGTLDSFFVSILRAFPFEFGLGGDFEIMSEYADSRSRVEVLQRILQQDSGHRSGFLHEQYNLLNPGKDEYAVHRQLDQFTRELQVVYQLLPFAEAWGVRETIWPGGFPWISTGIKEIKHATDRLLQELELLEMDDKSREFWKEFCQEVIEFQEGMAYSTRIRYFLERLLPEIPLIQQGGIDLKTSRSRYRLDKSGCEPLLVLLNHIGNRVISPQLQRTKGLHALLMTFEQTYDQLVRRRGRLSFNDVLYLLAGGGVDEEQTAARLDLDYRLDASIDHWLLDEFQDTSSLQWRAIANLVDEVLQDDSGIRSLFYVGDTKQAIYNWRGGRASLFNDILAHYNQTGERIASQRLSQSWRSAPPIIAAVNRVFGNLPKAAGLPAAASNRWQETWREHTTARTSWSGYAQLQVVPPGKTEPLQTAATFLQTAELLTELAPWERGWSCAVLVRKNETGRELVDLLQSRQIPAVWEGELPVAASQLVQGLLSLVRAAAHPGDSAGWGYLMMTPLALVIAREFAGSRAQVSESVLRTIDRQGYAGLVEWWRNKLLQQQLLPPAEQQQALTLVEAALEFDQLGEGAPLDFIEFVRDYRKREPLPSGIVQVTTLHQSKGLQYDIVILPELHGAGGRRTPLLRATGQGDSSSLDWLLTTPQILFTRADPVLNRQLERQEAEEWYERLCLLYVGMTRAVHGLYLVVPERGKSASAARLSTILLDTLAMGWQPDEPGSTIAWETGEPRWYLHPAEEQSVPVRPPKLLSLQLQPGGRRRRLDRVTPSGAISSEFEASAIFSQNYALAADYGTAIHSLLERIEWLDDCDTEALLAEWEHSTQLPESIKIEVGRQYRILTEIPAVRELLSRPAGTAELWRERRFELADKGEWISGSFDRVVIKGDTEGAPLSATIIDFKSSGIDRDNYRQHLCQTYGPQLDIYQRVLTNLTGLPASSIRMALVLTRNGEVLEIRSGPE
ncbi:MAG: UvrD-helicase domain-containing protein [Candidatus Delongbacteria bacterium]|nr:UvrD-helicase domain-containing protein [Candidatus Delongbacteria bacterium]